MRSAVVLALGAAAGACAERAPVTTLVRDSAAVAVAETPAPALAAAPAWRLAEPPLLEIGDVEGDPALQFADIEGVLRLGDGRIVVADRGSAEIRFFDERGRHLGSQGGPGEAPGEYRYLTSLGAGPGDSLWAYDFGLRRFTVLAGTGETVRTVSIGSALAAVTAVGRLPDGAFVIQEQWSGATHAGPHAGLTRDPAAVARLASDGATLDTITLVAGREVFIGGEGGRAVMSAPLLARRAVAAIRDSLVYVGDQARFEIRVYRPWGGLAGIVRVTGLDLAVGSGELERATIARLAEAPEGERAMLRAHYRTMTAPSTRPAYGPLLVDDDGNLLVGSYEHAGPPRSWTVFGPDGALRATLAVPERFQLGQIAGDLAIGTWRDSLDVEFVRVYSVRR